jgi:hypothetical protein
MARGKSKRAGKCERRIKRGVSGAGHCGNGICSYPVANDYIRNAPLSRHRYRHV